MIKIVITSQSKPVMSIKTACALNSCTSFHLHGPRFQNTSFINQKTFRVDVGGIFFYFIWGEPRKRNRQTRRTSCKGVLKRSAHGIIVGP